VDLLAAWLLYPLALGVICLGLGLLVARLAAWRVPGPLLLPLGFATLLAVARLVTEEPATARLALPVVGALTLAGLVAGRRRLRELRPDPLVAVAALGVFLVAGAPVLASGSPSFAGYLVLPDTSHQLSLAELYAEHGSDPAALPEGSNRSSLLTYVAGSYPVAAQAALGVTAPLGILDLAWLYQPFITWMLVMACLALASIAAPLLRRRWQVALAAFVAAQPALVVGFAQQGSIKELAALTMLVTVVALVAAAMREQAAARALLTVAIAAAAALGSLGPAVLPYLGVAGLAVLAVWGVRVARGGRRSELAWIGAAAVLALVLTAPVLATIRTQITVNTATLDAAAAPTGSGADLGNLAEPLSTAQALGIWLSGDYRYATTTLGRPQSILLLTVGVAALLGLAWALRRRAWGPLLLFGALAGPSAYLLTRGSPYADAKVLAIVSPAIVLLAMLGALSLWRGRWRVPSALLAAALAGGVLWSNALAYHEVSLAPYDRYAELLDLNERLAGRGPAVLNEYDEFGKYFLRDVPGLSQPEWPHGYREEPYSPNALIDPRRRPSLKTPLDVDDLTLDYLQSVPLIVMRRSPVYSRPPASFRLVSRGADYDVWRRRAAGARVVAHQPLGPDYLRPAQRVTRAAARAWAARARRMGGDIAFVERAPMPAFLVTKLPRPPTWPAYGDLPQAAVPAGPARIRGSVRIARGGRYRVWIEGSFARRLTLSVNGRRIGHTPFELNNPGAYAPLGQARLARGRHSVQLSQGGGDLRPSNGGYRSSHRHVGPILFAPAADERRAVRTIAARDWRRLVGVNADWLEIVRR
jgi:hypothetical protein